MLSDVPDYVWKLLWPLLFMAEVCGIMLCFGKILWLINVLPDMLIDTFWIREKKIKR